MYKTLSGQIFAQGSSVCVLSPKNSSFCPMDFNTLTSLLTPRLLLTTITRAYSRSPCGCQTESQSCDCQNSILSFSFPEHASPKIPTPLAVKSITIQILVSVRVFELKESELREDELRESDGCDRISP